MKVQKTIDQLKPGMFVSELDRPWLDTPFPLQGVLIQSQEDIERLQEYCQYVYVDPLREQLDPSTSRLELGPLVGSLGKGVPIGAVAYPDQRNTEEELPRARETYNTAAELFKQLRDNVQRNKALDVKSASVLVESLVETVIANPDAMLLLLRLRQEVELTYAQAMAVAANLLALGRHLGLPREELSVIGMAGLLLDIGMIRLPKELVEKRQALSRAEHALIKRHVAYGEEILRGTHGISERVIEILREHHEREDGSGYPKGLLSAQISVYGKMTSIVDCYRELIFSDVAGMAVSPYRALEILHGWAGRFFHPVLVERFIQCIGIYPAGSLVELNTGEVAIVVAHSRVRRMNPRVMIILDPRKRRYKEPKSVDLMYGPISDAGVPYEIKRELEPGMYGIDPKDYYL